MHSNEFTEKESSTLKVIKEDYSIWLTLEDGRKAAVIKLESSHTLGKVRILYEIDNESYERSCYSDSKLGNSAIEVMILLDREIAAGSLLGEGPYPKRFLNAKKITEMRGHVELWVHERDNLYRRLDTEWDHYGTHFSIDSDPVPKSPRDIELSMWYTLRTIEDDSFSKEMLNVEREKDLATKYLKEFSYEKL